MQTSVSSDHLNQAESGRYEMRSYVARDTTILRTVQMVSLWYVAALKGISLPHLPSQYCSKNVKSSWFARLF